MGARHSLVYPGLMVRFFPWHPVFPFLLFPLLLAIVLARCGRYAIHFSFVFFGRIYLETVPNLLGRRPPKKHSGLQVKPATLNDDKPIYY
jgi:hypothetical protein